MVAAVICAQIGFVGLRRADRSQELERELAELRLETAERVERLSHQLAATRARSMQLRATLQRTSAERMELERELAEARSRAAAMQGRLSQLSDMVRDEPPALSLRVEPGEPLAELVAVAENAGPHALRIVESSGRLWIGDLEEAVTGAPPDVAVGPGVAIDLFDLPLLADEPSRVANGSVPLRGAVCVAYERSLDAAAGAWAREVWFEYRPGLRTTAVIRQDRWRVAPDEVPCDLAAVDRPW